MRRFFGLCQVHYEILVEDIAWNVVSVSLEAATEATRVIGEC